MQHVMYNPLRSDEYAPDHQLHDGQYFWRDATREDYEWMYRDVVKEKGKEYVSKLIDEQMERRQPWLDCHMPWRAS
jgi:hypothetical protein